MASFLLRACHMRMASTKRSLGSALLVFSRVTWRSPLPPMGLLLVGVIGSQPWPPELTPFPFSSPHCCKDLANQVEIACSPYSFVRHRHLVRGDHYYREWRSLLYHSHRAPRNLFTPDQWAFYCIRCSSYTLRMLIVMLTVSRSLR